MSKNFIEIERKFLVKPDFISYKHLVLEDAFSTSLEQAYLVKNDNGSVRIRIEKPAFGNPTAYLMSKTKVREIDSTQNTPPSNIETNDMINIENARQLIKTFAVSLIEKTRYELMYCGKKWEIDFFHAPANVKGLILVEVELNSADEIIEIPDWVGEEVTSDPRYYNANM